MPTVIDCTSAHHFVWGGICDGWRLLDREDLSVIEELVPPGGEEEWHVHARARQLFYVLEGSALMRTEEGDVKLDRGTSVEIEPGVAHTFANSGSGDVRLLIISSPASRGDRTTVPGRD